jgi:hypothetical protein
MTYAGFRQDSSCSSFRAIREAVTTASRFVSNSDDARRLFFVEQANLVENVLQLPPMFAHNLLG